MHNVSLKCLAIFALLQVLLLTGIAAAEEAADAEPAAEPSSDTAPAEASSPPAAPADEAVAENVREARERVTRGEELFEQGNFDAALVEFQQAYDVIGDHPNRYLVLYNIGQCHERSFRYDLALRFYRQYLEEGGDGADGRQEVEDALARLEGLLATVRIEVNLDRATVWVDEREVGTAPGSVRIPGGGHTIELRAEGHLPSQREVSVPAGGELDVAFELEPLPEEFQGLHRAYFWTSASLALGSLVAAVAFGIDAFQAHNDVDRRLEDEEAQWEVTQGEIDEIGDRALAADILFGAAALFTIGAIVFALLTDWDGEPNQSPQVSLLTGRHRAGLFGSLRF